MAVVNIFQDSTEPGQPFAVLDIAYQVQLVCYQIKDDSSELTYINILQNDTMANQNIIIYEQKSIY
jgi:hypothetical protein